MEVKKDAMQFLGMAVGGGFLEGPKVEGGGVGTSSC